MSRRRARPAAVLSVALALGPTLGIGLSVAAIGSFATAATAAVHAERQTTTTASTTTSTTAATTTTTTHVTTTTSSTTTSSHVTTTTHPATTTSHPAATTTHQVTTTSRAAATSSSVPWGWIVLAVAVVLAIALVALLIARSRRKGRQAAWRESVRPALAEAELARQLVLSQSPDDDDQRRAHVGAQVDSAMDGLERAANTAPGETERSLSARSAESLRGLAFAVEADHLMRSGGQHPSGEQLASADQARRNRTAELDAALTQLRSVVGPTPHRA